MSLKSMHLILIAVLVAGACLAGALWAASFFQAGGIGMLAAAVAAFLFGIALIVHLLDFLARSQELPWI